MCLNDENYMRRCLDLARCGAGSASPNPMVGSVIVYNDRIIGEGFHYQAGEPHAEVNAIASVRDESLLRQATLYVNLEPCSHYGRTPPCAELIIRKQIPRVVVACLDPFPEVAGRGVAMLREAGIEVVTGLLEEEARELNRFFITSHEKNRPYILLKWAASADGFIDRERNDNQQPPVAFSSPQNLRSSHRLRSEYAAIMVATRTALLDNPSLTVRHWWGRPPVRILLDRTLKVPAHYHLLDGSVETLVFTEKRAISRHNVEYLTIDFSQSPLQQVMRELHRRRLHSLIVEGGAALLSQCIQEELYDEIRVETAPFALGSGIAAPILPPHIALQSSDSDVNYYRRKKTNNF